MTEQEQQIAIAAACGWKRVSHKQQYDSEAQEHRDWAHWEGPGGEIDCAPPDYLHDLNAIGLAVDELSYEDYQQFCLELGSIVNRDWKKKWIVPAERKAINAKANQRAEAFLKAKGLWKD